MGASTSRSTNSRSTTKRYTDMHKKELKPGDLIEIFRGAFQHWAVYVGGGNVVHFVVPDQGANSSSMTLVGCYGTVNKEQLQDVVGADSWRINNLLDHKYRPRPVEVIVKEACSMVGAYLPYSIITNNCEHFATELRYGKPKCQQVQDAAEAGMLGVLILGLGTVVLGLFGVSRT